MTFKRTSPGESVEENSRNGAQTRCTALSELDTVNTLKSKPRALNQANSLIKKQASNLTTDVCSLDAKA